MVWGVSCHGERQRSSGVRCEELGLLKLLWVGQAAPCSPEERWKEPALLQRLPLGKCTP